MLLPSIRLMLQRLLPATFHRSQCKCGCDDGIRTRCEDAFDSTEENLDCAPVLVPIRLAPVVDDEFIERSVRS